MYVFLFLYRTVCVCVCLFMGGLGQSSRKPHITHLGLVTLREEPLFMKTYIYTQFLKAQTLPGLTLTRPVNRITNRQTQGILGNRKQEVGPVQAECESCVHNELCMELAVCGKAGKDKLAH